MTHGVPPGNRIPAGGASGAVYPISLCMIVRNEERFLNDALTSVEGVVDEICIVDTGSTDGTVAIAETFGASVRFVSWRDDFAWARNQALDLATGAWILVLDADERLAPESIPMLRHLRTVKPDGQGRWIRCRNFSDPERAIVSSTNAIIRIFPNEPDVRYRGAIHEFVARDGDERSLGAIMTPVEIHHYGYVPTIMLGRSKAERNLRVSRTSFLAAPGDPAHVYNYAMSALLAGERDTAREQLERIAEITRNTPRGFRPMALTTLAGIYIEDGRHADALAVADECVSIVASLPDGQFARGRALAGLGRFDEARAALGEAISVGLNQTFEHFVVDDEIAVWKAHNEIGGTLVQQARYPEALQWLDLALKARPAERVLILNRAKCCEANGDLAGALVGFRGAFEGFRDENSAIEYVNFVFRHGSPDIALAAVESTLPVLGDDYQRAFLVSASAGLLRAGRRGDAAPLIMRVLAVGGSPDVGRAIIKSLAEKYGLPELNALASGPLPASITVTGRVQ